MGGTGCGEGSKAPKLGQRAFFERKPSWMFETKGAFRGVQEREVLEKIDRELPDHSSKRFRKVGKTDIHHQKPRTTARRCLDEREKRTGKEALEKGKAELLGNQKKIHARRRAGTKAEKGGGRDERRQPLIRVELGTVKTPLNRARPAEPPPQVSAGKTKESQRAVH